MKYGQLKVLTLFLVARICDPLTPHPLADTKEMYPHLSGLELADDLGVSLVSTKCHNGHTLLTNSRQGELVPHIICNLGSLTAGVHHDLSS